MSLTDSHRASANLQPAGCLTTMVLSLHTWHDLVSPSEPREWLGSC